MTILFDLDGTLIDTAPDFIAAVNQLRTQRGLSPLPSALQLAVRLAVTDGIKAITQAGFELMPEEDSALSQQLLETYQQNLGISAKPFPGIEALLNLLDAHQIQWGIVTNKQARFTEPLLERLGLIHRAACIVSGDTTAYAKPHPAPLLHACTQMTVLPKQCIYIGDAKQDILAGQAAGMTTVVALFGYIRDPALAREWGAHHYVSHPDEIFPWFKKWSEVLQ